MRVRLADPERDAERIAEIYRPNVEATVISFEEVAPSAAEMAGRIQSVLAWTPWLVALDEKSRVIGYTYASRHRERAGYRWSVDPAVYVDPSFQGRGVGKVLYGELLPILRRQRFVNAYAGVGLPNDASVELHESIGMSRGVYEKVGWKLGRWVDVAWYGMRLVEPVDDGPRPAEPVPFSSIAREVARVLEAGTVSQG
ncbi:MAG TPA: GNAT family N-acetyltransferase [Candidatus Limnocylindrales bacterium]